MQSSQLLPLGSLLLSFATPLAQADALHEGRGERQHLVMLRL